MNYNKKSIEDIDVAGKRVLCRCDFNVFNGLLVVVHSYFLHLVYYIFNMGCGGKESTMPAC